MNKEKQQEQEAWIEAHGSERLRKAVELGMLDVSQGIYRDERVQELFPGWFCGEGAKYSQILNPTLPELDLLGHIRKTAPDAILLRMLRHDRWVSVVVIEREVPSLDYAGPDVRLFTYCLAMEAFAHTGELGQETYGRIWDRPPK